MSEAIIAAIQYVVVAAGEAASSITIVGYASTIATVLYYVAPAVGAPTFTSASRRGKGAP